MLKQFPLLSATIIGSFLAVPAASANIFTIDFADAGVWNAYNSETQYYSMTFSDTGSKDGFWLVVSDGPNPKSHENEYAILYGDRTNNRISAYSFDGNNGPGSYNTGTFLGSFENVFEPGAEMKGMEMTQFSIDVSQINAAFETEGWSGVQFGEEAGIWFHQSENSEFAYNEDGSISSYSFTDQMWIDTAFDETLTRTSNRCVVYPNLYYCGESASLTTASNTGGFSSSGMNDGGFAGGSGVGGSEGGLTAGTTSGGTVNTGSAGGGGSATGAPAGGGSVPVPGGLAFILVAAAAAFGLRRRS